MSSPTIATIIKMVESLPSDAQERLADHIRDYIAELNDEMRWDNSFKRTQTSLIAAAHRAKQEDCAGSIDTDGLQTAMKCSKGKLSIAGFLRKFAIGGDFGVGVSAIG